MGPKDNLSDRYRIERELGAGGMATVYKALDVKHERAVAVKVLRPELAASVGAERFLREIRITAGLSHPHILPLLDSGNDGGSLYYVMPLVDGESLQARLDREKQLPIPDALAIARAVAGALAFAHQHGVIHRDIKPANILLSPSGPMVADFGIARALGPAGGGVTETGMALGTPGYMSPEQALGDEALTARSDVYSLGCLLYEMLVGEPPFTGPTPQTIVARALSAPAPRAKATRDTVPEAVDDVIATALAKSPADRFPDAGAFAEALARAESAPAATRRRPSKLAWSVAAVGILAAVALIFVITNRGSARRGVPTVVVLPFENLGTPDDAGFADGVTDEITAKLADVQGLAVKARQSAIAYRGTQKTPQQIGRELGVDYLVEATLSWERRPDGQRRVRVRPQLIRTSDGNHIWATTFDEDVTEVFVVQAKIANQVVAALTPAVLPQQAGDVRRGTTDAQTYYATALTRAIPRDPELRAGTLDNGLRYYIRANAQPRGRADFRLIVNAGSMVEGEGEHGIAHLIEHMVFDGTPLFNGRLEPYLRSVGVGYGGDDLNGQVSQQAMTLFVRVPTQRAIVVDSTVRILRSWASDVRFDPGVVDRARRVVREEWRSTMGYSGEAGSKLLTEYLRDVPAAAHSPIGDMDVVMRATPASLAQFYEKWYRPERMAVIAVGDFAADSMEQLVRRHFADFKRDGPPPVPPNEKVLDRKETRVAVIASERASQRVSVNYLQPADTLLTIGSYREAVVRGALLTMLQTRLSERSFDVRPPFLGASVTRDAMTGGTRSFDLSASVADSGAARALEGLLVESERAVRHGFTERELTRAKARLLRMKQQSYDERGKRLSAAYATEYGDAFLQGSPLPGIAFEYGLFKRFLPTITAEEVHALAQRWLADRNRTVIAIVRGAPGTRATARTDADLRAMLETVRVADVGPYQDPPDSVAFPVAVARAGTITKVEELQSIGVTIWSLSNGARVVLKPTDFSADDIQFQAFRNGGTSLADDGDYLSAVMAPVLATRSGFGSLTGVELRRTLADKIVQLAPNLRIDGEGFVGRASPKDLEAFFRLLALHFTEPRVDSAAFQTFIAGFHGNAATRSGSPNMVWQDSIAATMANGARRLLPMGDARIRELDLGKALSFYRARFSDASGFTFVFAGSFDLAKMRPLVETYVGGLPASKRPSHWRDLGLQPPPGVIRKVVHGGDPTQALTAILFSGSFDYADSSRQILRSLGDVLQTRLMETLREKMAGTYFAAASPSYESAPRPTYRMSINFSSSVERADELTATAFKIIEDLATNGPSADEVARVREVQRKTRETNLRDNAYWATNLLGMARIGGDMRRIASYDLIDRQTPSMIRDAAKRYLPVDRHVLVQLVP